jgi:hypothetical protein
MGIRDKFRATPVAAFKKKVEEENEELAVGKNDYLQCEDGKTIKIRFLPAHPGGEDFYVRRKMHWVTVENDEGDKGRRTVPNSIQHGGYEKDIIEEYMAFAATSLNPKDKDDLEKLEAIRGDYPRKDGLKGSNTWVAYALKIDGTKREFGLFEFKKQVRDAINKETLTEDAENPIEVDPFTDPDNGYAVLIKYLSKPNKKKGEDFYDTTLAKKPTPVTDEELERLEKATPLTELYGKYTMKDFERALNGLQNFDSEHEVGLFENEDWLKIVEEVRAQFDEEEEETDKPSKKAKAVDKKKQVAKPSSKKVLVKDEEEEADDEQEDAPAAEEGDELDGMERNDLKQLIADKELEIVVKKSMSDDDIRALIRELLPSEEATDEADDEEPYDEPEATSEVDILIETLDRTELKQYIADNQLEVVVRKSMTEDDIRDAIRAAMNPSEEADEEEEETPAPAAKPAAKTGKLTADQIRAKLKRG